MHTLTLNSIRKNPWNVLLRELPAQPGRLLLEAARMAAEYCRDSDGMLMKAAADGRLRLYVRNPDTLRGAYDECQMFHDAACYKLDEIDELIESEFDTNAVL